MAKARIERFLKALRENPEASAPVPDGTWKRWVSAEFPSNIHWLLRAPEILHALAEDAADWTEEEWADIERAASRRRTTQAAYRKGEPRSPRGRPKKQ